MQLAKKGAKTIHQDIVMICIMERMWRSYEEYMNTPARIVDLVLQKINTDDKYGTKGY